MRRKEMGNGVKDIGKRVADPGSKEWRVESNLYKSEDIKKPDKKRKLWLKKDIRNGRIRDRKKTKKKMEICGGVIKTPVDETTEVTTSPENVPLPSEPLPQGQN